MPLIHIAVEQGKTEKVQYLLGEDPSVVSLPASAEIPDLPLHIAAANNRLSIASILLSSGADVNALGFLGRTPLHYAVLNASDRMVKLLLGNGANPATLDSLGFTPSFAAARSNGKNAAKIVRLLVDAGAGLDLNTAICLGEVAKIWALLGDQTEFTAQFVDDLVYDFVVALASEFMEADACWEIDEEEEQRILDGWMPVLTRFVELGVPVNKPSMGKWPPLFEAVQLPVIDVAAILLENGADPNFRSETGSSAWELARSSLRADKMRELLLDAGFSA